MAATLRFKDGKSEVTPNKVTQMKPEIVRDSFPAGMDPNQRISLPFLEELQTFFVKEKFLRDKIDVNKIVDLSFADAAVKELGTYK